MDEILRFYQEEWKESERLMSQAGQIEYITTMNYLKKYCEPGKTVLDACAGGGIYSFALADIGCHVTAGDLIGTNVDYIKSIDAGRLKGIYEGSVLDLSRFADDSFDIVLNLGSYYHLCDNNDRKKSIAETMRVLKSGGMYMLSYINRCANYMAHFSELKDNISFLERYMKNGHIDDSTLFYAATPEMVENELESFPLQILHNIAVDGPIFIYREIVDQMSKEDFNTFMNIHLNICDKKSNLGYSEHGLIVARKQ